MTMAFAHGRDDGACEYARVGNHQRSAFPFQLHYSQPDNKTATCRFAPARIDTTHITDEPSNPIPPASQQHKIQTRAKMAMASDKSAELLATRELKETVGVQLLENAIRLYAELIEDATETRNGIPLMAKKLKCSKVLPLLNEFEAELRTMRDELRSERQAAGTLSDILRGTTRALLEAPDEAVKMTIEGLPPTFGVALIQWVKAARGDGIGMDAVFSALPKKRIRLSSSAEERSAVTQETSTVGQKLGTTAPHADR